MIVKEPTITVPVTTFLELVRLYQANRQEALNIEHYLRAIHLEKRAYRKYLAYKKELKK